MRAAESPGFQRVSALQSLGPPSRAAGDAQLVVEHLVGSGYPRIHGGAANPNYRVSRQLLTRVQARHQEASQHGK